MLRYHFKNLWFRDKSEDVIFINKYAVQMRAGLMLILPIYMVIVLFTTVLAPTWTVLPNTFVEETFDMTEEWRTIFNVQAYRTVFDYTIPSLVLLYGLFEMLAGMFVRTAYLSPTIHLATFLTRNIRPKWEPLKPKRFAWLIGATLIVSCLTFFNPDTVARFINALFSAELLPTDSNWMPNFIPLLVGVCFVLMWMEAVFGFCLGCKLHWVLAKLGIFKDFCYDCMNVDFDQRAWMEERKSLEAALKGK
ncbi:MULTISPECIES: DUF4395 family protein [Thiomicrorhabdus]|uniref:DUF4395 family protein n=1 Tax=Thiomicrorhabdus heinhorstiae TaxID=2748010 RepID=A0ABS0BUA3_9GAMM|nr:MULTISPECIES: DUF4395 family protein [Thiomicrorhabdus]MBF6057416.1 DUF4395 family protein [Thiomicrorhabdus heinhorstiae]